MTAYKTNVALQLSIKKLDIYQGSFIWLSILSSLAAPISLGGAGAGAEDGLELGKHSGVSR